MQITSLRHSCLLIESGDTRVLVDPGAFSPEWETLEGLDAVLITHQHPDHVDVARLPGLVAMNPGLKVLAEPAVAAFEQLFTLDADITPFAAGDETVVGELTIEGVGGEHATIYREIPVIGNVGMVISDPSTRLFHPGDSLTAVPSDIDVLAVPLMAPWMAMKEMIDFTRAVSPRVAGPIHDGLLADAGRSLFMTQMTNFGGAQDVYDWSGEPLVL